MCSSDETNSTSVNLLRRLRLFDPGAWDRFARLYTPVVYQWCQQSGLQDADAADITQETFRSVARAIENFRKENDGHSFRAWLWTIAQNKLRDHFRKQSLNPRAIGGSSLKQRMAEIPDPVMEWGSEDSDDEIQAGIAQRALALIENEFQPRTWQAFLRTAVGGQDASSVAGDLGMSVGAVYTAKSRVLRRLREEIGDLL